MSRESLALIRAVVGLAQGVALYLLYDAAEAKIWPATSAEAFAPLVLIAFFIPIMGVASLGALRLRTLAIWLGIATVIVAALGIYDVHIDPSGGLYDMAAGTEVRILPSLALWLATAAGLAIAHTIIAAGDANRVWIAKYPRYFDVAWKHAVQIALAGAFVGALWVLLLLGAALFHVIGIGFFADLLRKAWFSAPVTTLAFAAALHVTDVQADIVRGVRTLALTLLSWLLPPFAVIVIAFLAALPFTGLDPLWATRHATDLVLIAAAALIVLINAAYQDGVREQPVALVLRCAGIGAAAALTPLVAIAAHAVMLRVNQYGWTPERVIATAGVVVAACYTIGYGLAVITRRSWLQRIETANLVTAAVMVAAILALFSPVADPARIAVADQVARLEAGRTPVDKFDFKFLRFHGGRYGMAALDRLGKKTDGPNAARIAELANAMLAAKSEYEMAPVVSTPAERAANIAVAFPKGRSVPATFLQQDWNAMPHQAWIPRCLTEQVKCDAILLDVDGDGVAEILLSSPPLDRFFVYKEIGGTWTMFGDLRNSDCRGVREALLAGNFETVTSDLREVRAGGATLQILIEHGCPEKP